MEHRLKPAEIIERLVAETDGQAVLYPNYEEALIGICRRFNQPSVALYDYKKCIEILMRDAENEEEAYERAVEWFEFNTAGCWVGEYTPAFAYLDEM